MGRQVFSTCSCALSTSWCIVLTNTSNRTHSPPNTRISHESLTNPSPQVLFSNFLGEFDSTLVMIDEQIVYLLQRQVGGFGVAEIDQRYQGEIGGHEDQVRFPLKSIDDNRSGHDNEKRSVQSSCQQLL
jgi:hypothetical protein